MPALAEARRRLLGLCERQARSPASSPRRSSPTPRWRSRSCAPPTTARARPAAPAGVREAVESLHADGVALARRAARHLRHARAARASARSATSASAATPSRCAIAAERIGELARLPQRDELAVAALLHDVGQLVLAELYGDEHAIDGRGETPEERARRERRELGIDHALVGAVLVRRWGLPPIIAAAVERHHAADADRPRRRDPARRPDRPPRRGRPGLRRRRCARPPRRSSIDDAGAQRAAVRVPARRRAPAPARPSRARSRRARSTPCAGLAEGKVYKQIAQELTLSVSTVRTHLHNVYRKIGAVDRAQAVLIARDRGWL